MSVSLRDMTMADYPAVRDLWARTPGVGMNESDSAEATAAYLERNPRMSAVAVSAAGDVVGAVLCGHDGRRGYLHHLAVDASVRRQGIARRLLERCFDALEHADIPKCNVFLFAENREGREFWRHNGWAERSDLQVLQHPVGSSAAASRAS